MNNEPTIESLAAEFDLRGLDYEDQAARLRGEIAHLLEVWPISARAIALDEARGEVARS